MYAEWASLSTVIAANISGSQSQSVLNKFAVPAGKVIYI